MTRASKKAKLADAIQYDASSKFAPSGKPWSYGLRTCGPLGQSHSGFRWNLTEGATVVAPDWEATTSCGAGLHANKFGLENMDLLSLIDGNKLKIIRWDSALEINLDGKHKFPWAQVVKVGEVSDLDKFKAELFDLWCEHLLTIEGDYSGYVYLEGYSQPLPAGLTSIGGGVDLRGYSQPLPAGLTSIGGGVYLEGYSQPLPAGLTSIGGYVDLEGYSQPLPAGLTSIGGYVDLRGYSQPLPAGLTVKGGIY